MLNPQAVATEAWALAKNEMEQHDEGTPTFTHTSSHGSSFERSEDNPDAFSVLIVGRAANSPENVLLVSGDAFGQSAMWVRGEARLRFLKDVIGRTLGAIHETKTEFSDVMTAEEASAV